MKRLLFIAAGAFLFAAPTFADDAAALIRQGDAVFAGRTASTGAVEALDFYRRAADAAPTDAVSRWKAGKALLWLGDHARRGERRAYYEDGIRMAEASVRLDPNSPATRFWLAAIYGSYGEFRGVMKSLALLKPIRTQLEAVNRLDPRWGGGAGIRVLGVVDYKVPGIAGGSKKRAIERLSEAVRIDPANPFNNYYMAECLMESGRKKDAGPYLDAVARATTSADVDAPDLAMIQEKARLLAKKLR